jgi:hypothetical protein
MVRKSSSGYLKVVVEALADAIERVIDLAHVDGPLGARARDALIQFEGIPVDLQLERAHLLS